jgi:uncharacterized protein YjiS (DUF1127 family)
LDRSKIMDFESRADSSGRGGVVGALARLRARMVEADRRSRDAVRLAGLPDRVLRDAGLTRDGLSRLGRD